MASKVRGSSIKKSRIMLILKSRHITITKLAEDLGYNRKSISFAINREYMDLKTLDDIARYLNVAPTFFTGEYPLRRLKEEYKDSFVFDGLTFQLGNSDPTGYDIPTYKYWQDIQAMKTGVSRLVQEQNGNYYNLLIAEGEKGIRIPGNDQPVHFDSKFVYENSSFLLPPIRQAVVNTVGSALNKDAAYIRWEGEQSLKEVEINNFPDIFETIEEGKAPEGDQDE